MNLSPSFFGAASSIAGAARNFTAKHAAVGILRPDKLAVLAVNIGGGGLNYGWSSQALWWFALQNYYTTKNPTCKGKYAYSGKNMHIF
jgi:hypothetical protein